MRRIWCCRYRIQKILFNLLKEKTFMKAKNIELAGIIACIGLSQLASCQEEGLVMNSNDVSYVAFAKDMTKECKEYDQLIINNPIDIQILGIGMDGHIAYNEPGSSFDSESHVVDLHPESIQSSLDYGFTKIEDVPTQGVTQGIKTIMKARQLIMIAKGNKKAKLVERMLYGPVSEDFPSSIIQTHNNVIVVLDQCAAANLKEETYERR